jgi:transcriptional regulator with XRE-family HTH domain
MTPADLSRASGASRADITKYESGQASPQPPRLAVIAAALGVPAASLLEPPPGGPGLAHLRAAAGLTQAGLAAMTGIGLSRYELAEVGLRRLADEDITRVAAATGTTARQVRAAHQRDVGRAAAPRRKGLGKALPIPYNE